MALHRYWRINVTETTSGADHLLSCYEFEMRATVGGTDQCTGGTASASVNSSTAYKLFDNTTATYWVNGGPSVDFWFQYDFGAGNEVTVLELQFMPRYVGQSLKDFQLQYSDNGTDFFTLNSWTEVSGWIGGVEKLFQVPVPPPIVQQWDLPFSLRAITKKSWDLLYGESLAGIQWSLPYGNPIDLQWIFPFDLLIEVAKQYSFPYDSPTVQQWETPYSLRVERQWEELWRRGLGQSWTIPVHYTLRKTWSLPYAMRGTVPKQWDIPYTDSNTIHRQWEIPFELLGLNPVVKVWKFFWDLIPASVMVDAGVTVTLQHQGNLVRLLSASIGLSEGEYAWTGKLEIGDVAAFQPMAVDDPVWFTLGGETYSLIIDNRTISREGGGRPRMAISVISSTALMAAPRTFPMEKTWETAVQAKEAAEEVVGVGLEWQLVNWLIPGGHLAVYNAAPLEVVQTIVRAAGGVVETKPNGSLRVRHRFPVAVPGWESTVVDHVLTDVAHNLSVSESHRFRTRVNRVTVREYQPTTGYLSAEVDGREDGLNRGHTAFGPGSTSHFLVHAGPGVSVTDLDSTDGTLFPGGSQAFQIEEDLTFSGSAQTRISRPAKSLDSCIWMGRNLGNLILATDGMTVTAENSGLAIARVKYTVTPSSWGITSPSNLGGLDEFPVAVRITGTDGGVAGEDETTFQRGDGQFPGEDIAEPLLSGFLAKQSRGRAEIDSGESLQEVSLTCVFLAGVMPGQLVEIHDALLGASWRGKVVSVNHSVQNPVVTTALGLLRYVSG